MERNAGTTIFGRLELIREEASTVGVQVFGPTWAVFDGVSGELARACILDAELLPDEASRKAFLAGLEPLTNLSDSTLVPQLFAGVDEQGGGILYEPLAGGVAFDDLYDGTGSFDLSAEVGRMARALARALASLHTRGHVHGMLTSACVFVGPRGPAVYQYGLAPLCDRTVLLRRIRAFNLPSVAPEVMAGGDFTPGADLYAWAVTIAQFAAAARGAPAIESARGSQELPGLSPGLRAVLQSCLSDDPAGRPRDGVELLRIIELAGLTDNPIARDSTVAGAVPSEGPAASLSSGAVPEPEPSPVSEASPAPAIEASPAAASATRMPVAPEPAEAPPAVVREPQSEPASPEPTAEAAASLAASTSPPAPVSVPAAAGVAIPAFVPLLPAIKPSGPPRPPTLPPTPTARPPVPRDRPPTMPPVPRTLPITSFEERLTANERPRRPATLVLEPPVAGEPASREVIELSGDDVVGESGTWKGTPAPSGKSASNLRRVHVLTDPVHRGPDDSHEVVAARVPPPEDVPADRPERTPSRGEMIIGGTREELEAASKATTLRLDPVSAAAAVLAATEAASASQQRLAAVAPEAAPQPSPTASPSPTEPTRTPDPSSSASVEVATDSGAHEPAASHSNAPTASRSTSEIGAPVSGSRRRSSAMSSSGEGEPRDWGKIPPIAELVPVAAPARVPATPPLGRTLPEVAGARKLPLLPILVVIALALLAMLYLV